MHRAYKKILSVTPICKQVKKRILIEWQIWHQGVDALHHVAGMIQLKRNNLKTRKA